MCTSRPRNKAGTVRVASAAGLARGGRIDFCGSTGLGPRSMYLFMMSVFLSSVVRGVSPTTCGSATRITGRIPTFTPKSRHRFHFASPAILSRRHASHTTEKLEASQSDRCDVCWHFLLHVGVSYSLANDCRIEGRTDSYHWTRHSCSRRSARRSQYVLVPGGRPFSHCSFDFVTKATSIELHCHGLNSCELEGAKPLSSPRGQLIESNQAAKKLPDPFDAQPA